MVSVLIADFFSFGSQGGFLFLKAMFCVLFSPPPVAADVVFVVYIELLLCVFSFFAFFVAGGSL